jgi:hypothetical protein
MLAIADDCFNHISAESELIIYIKMLTHNTKRNICKSRKENKEKIKRITQQDGIFILLSNNIKYSN